MAFSTFNVRKSSKRLRGKHDVFQFSMLFGAYFRSSGKFASCILQINVFLVSLHVKCRTMCWDCKVSPDLLNVAWLCGSENLRLQPLIISATSAISTIFDSELCDSAPDALQLKSLSYWNRASNLFEKSFQTVSILKIKCQSGTTCTL